MPEDCRDKSDEGSMNLLFHSASIDTYNVCFRQLRTFP